MAIASVGRADKGLSRAPARSARPCSLPASRLPGQGRGDEKPYSSQLAPALKRKERM
jgi:hypothetical protein